MNICSDKFGGNVFFVPEHVYDLNNLGNKLQETKFDYVIVELQYHEMISQLQCQNVVVDCTGGFMPQHLITNNSNLFGIVTDAPLCQSPPIYNTSLYYNHQILHTTSDSQTWTDCHELAELFKNSNDKIEITFVDSEKFIQLQWNRCIPFIMVQPLTIMYDTSNLYKLIHMSHVKAIYTGLYSELRKLALAHGCSEVVSMQFILENLICITPTTNNCSLIRQSDSMSSSSSNSSTNCSLTSFNSLSSLPPYFDAPLLYYNYFHSIYFSIDLLLYEPVCQAHNLNIDVPYLNSVYSMMKQFSRLNFVEGQRDEDLTLYSRIYKKREQAGNKMIRALQMREEQVARREQMVVQREQTLRNPECNNNYNNNYNNNNNNSVNKESDVDMMSLTSRRSSRRLSNQWDPKSQPRPMQYPQQQQQQQVRPSPSTLSLRQRYSRPSMPPPPPTPPLTHTPAPTTNAPFSQQLELDDVMSMSHTRYGTSLTNGHVRRISSQRSSYAPLSRTNSVSTFTNH